MDGDMIVMELRKDNLYKIKFTKVHYVDATDLTQWLTKKTMHVSLYTICLGTWMCWK